MITSGWTDRADAALERAYIWLNEQGLRRCLTAEARLLQVFGMFVARKQNPKLPVDLLRESAARLPMEAPGGDAVAVLVACRVLRELRLKHEGLSASAEMYGRVLRSEAADVGAELSLVVRLCELCGVEVPAVSLVGIMRPPDAQAAMELDRAGTLELCRTVMTSSCCGTQEMDTGELKLVLPGLCLSYAMEWDIEAVTVLLRACVYAGVSEEPCCGWASAWLLDQQDRDGHFGLLAPEMVEMDRATGGAANLGSTVGAVWSLAEMLQPGILVRESSNQASY